MSRIYVGTSSWADHAGFYPPGLPANQRISYYARHFPIVEINSSFYRLMPERNYRLWAERTPQGFIFDVKPYRQLTWHDREHPPEDKVSLAFRDSLQPLRETEKLGAVHFQFPPWFIYRQENLDYIRHVRSVFCQDRVGVEFRHRSWLSDEHVNEVVDALRDMDAALTVVDEPQVGSGSIPTLLEITDPDLSIVRFHGRNYRTWYSRTQTSGERFDYLYSEEVLREWVPQLGGLADRVAEVHVFFNNNAQDYAVRNAQQLRLLLAESLQGHQVIEPPAQL